MTIDEIIKKKLVDSKLQICGGGHIRDGSGVVICTINISGLDLRSAYAYATLIVEAAKKINRLRDEPCELSE